MSSGYNRVIMIGNLTKDPEVRAVGSQSVCKLNIASNRQYKNKQTGNMSQEVCFIDVDVWGVQADSCKLYLQKGRSVLVEGRLKLDSWKDAEGNAKSKHSILAEKVVFLASGAQKEESEDASEVVEIMDSVRKDAYIGAKSFSKEKSSFDKKSKKNDDDGFTFENKSPFSEDDLPF
jgi:single-strand DNA-binding protein